MEFQLKGTCVWERLKEATEPIIMYGTGNGADKVLDELERIGVKISGVTASSSFVRERSFRGFPVKALSYFEELYPSFTVIIAFGSSRQEVIDNIMSISKRHRVLVPCVPVIGSTCFNKAFFRENEENIKKAYSLLADDFSRKVYEGYINFLYTGELSLLEGITTPLYEAYENILCLSSDETFVDVGAYRGDTVEVFLGYTKGKYAYITAAEPDRKTFIKLMDNCGSLENFSGVNGAVTDVDGQVGFASLGGRQSAVGGDTLIESFTLKTLCGNRKPTYIKIDAEGCELEILGSSKEILGAAMPKMNIAAYHKNEDIFRIPIILKSINPDYRIHLRHHPYIPAWDTIFYCV